ncbi:hypothetical protein ACM9HF_01645 [Colwellia sp. RE-S-Sl-9]
MKGEYLGVRLFCIVKIKKQNINNNVLLVAGRDLKSIEKAYPNYLSDTSEFLAEYSRIILS